MRRVLFSTLLCALLLGRCKSETAPDSEAQPTTQAATKPASSNTDYGAERYRIVSRPDEIVSVLCNGATVITRRVDSPACAVRAYTYTGGVYEGKWLGGGLSHLLEHLVAGGSNARRTERQNLDLLQEIGNNSNAYTTDDHTSFYVDTTRDHMDQAVGMVTGMLL